MFDWDEIEKRAFLRLEEDEPVTSSDDVKSLLDHRWVGMALFLFLLGALFQNATLLTVTGFMLVIITAAWLWSRAALANVFYHRRFEHKRLFPGEQFEVSITIENNKLLPLGWLQVQDSWPEGVGPVDAEQLQRVRASDAVGFLTNSFTLRWYQRVRRRFLLEARYRGIFEIGPARSISGDPFSLFERERRLAPAELVIVYPAIKQLEDFGLPANDPLGDYRVRQRLFEDPNRIMGVRDYHPDDGIRHVHWKATARTGELQTKVYEPTRSASVVLCLNVATFEQHWRGIWPEMMEYMVSLAASLAYWGVEHDYSIGLAANGTLAYSDKAFRLLPSQNPDQLTRVLETLAGVSYFVTAEFGDYMLSESPYLSWGATLVLITPYLNDSIEAMIVRLRDSGRRVVLMALSKETPPEIKGVAVHHLPVEAEQPELPPEDGAEPDETETPRQRFLRARARQQQELLVRQQQEHELREAKGDAL